MKRQYTDKGSTRVGPNADAWVPVNGLKPEHGGLSAAVKQLKGKERSDRASARRSGVLPHSTPNADAGDPAWDTPAFTIRRLK